MAGTAVGRLLKAAILRRRVKRMGWEQIREGSLECGRRLAESVAGLPEEAGEATTAGYMSIRDILAHLTAANHAIAGRLDELRYRRPGSTAPPDLFAGAQGLSLAEVCTAHAQSLDRVAQVAAQPIVGEEAAPHDFFGEMNAREWLALVAFHHEYHARQLTRIMRSDAFRQSVGSRF